MAVDLDPINALRRFQPLLKPHHELLATDQQLAAPAKFRDTHRLEVLFREAFKHLAVDGVFTKPGRNLWVHRC